MNPTTNIEISIIPQKICSHFPPRKKKKVLNNIGFQFIKKFIVSILLFLGIYRICTSSPESFKKPTLSWCQPPELRASPCGSLTLHGFLTRTSRLYLELEPAVSTARHRVRPVQPAPASGTQTQTRMPRLHYGVKKSRRFLPGFRPNVIMALAVCIIYINLLPLLEAFLAGHRRV